MTKRADDNTFRWRETAELIWSEIFDTLSKVTGGNMILNVFIALFGVWCLPLTLSSANQDLPAVITLLARRLIGLLLKWKSPAPLTNASWIREVLYCWQKKCWPCPVLLPLLLKPGTPFCLILTAQDFFGLSDMAIYHLAFSSVVFFITIPTNVFTYSWMNLWVIWFQKHKPVASFQ